MFRVVQGPIASMRWGARVVGTLHGWTFTRAADPNDTGGTVTAQLATADEFGLDQRPLVVIAPVGRSQWRWPVRGFARDGATVTIAVGPVE